MELGCFKAAAICAISVSSAAGLAGKSRRTGIWIFTSHASTRSESTHVPCCSARKASAEFFVSAGKTYDTTVGYDPNGVVKYVYFEFPQKLSRPLRQLFYVTDVEIQNARAKLEELPQAHEKGRFFYIARPEEGFRLKIANREGLEILEVLVWEKGKPLP